MLAFRQKPGMDAQLLAAHNPTGFINNIPSRAMREWMRSKGVSMNRWCSWLRHAAVVLCAPVLIGFAASVHGAPVLGWTAPNGTSVNVGSTVRVQLSATGLNGSAGSSIGLFDLDVQHSASLRFIGGSFNAGGPGTNPLELIEGGASPFVGDFFDLGGTIDVFALSGNSQAALDAFQANDIVLFDLVFEALSADASAFVGVDLTDPFLLVGSSDPAVDLEATFDPASIGLSLVAGPLQIPEPSTWMLTGLAFAALSATRRRVLGSVGRMEVV